MKPKAESTAVGIFIAMSESAPKGVSGVNSGAWHSFTNEITTHANTPWPRLSGSSRRAGLRFDGMGNFFVWQLTNRQHVAKRLITVEEAI
jgi:hypothetical protein